MKNILYIILFSFIFVSVNAQSTDDELKAKANELAHKYILVDTHIDAPERMYDKPEDISQRLEDGEFDYVRAKEGGLDAPFMSVYIPARLQETGGAKAYADTIISLVNSFEQKWPDKFAVVTSSKEVKENFKKGIISLPMGMENGAGIEDELSNIKYFYDKGIRYITLTHSRDNLIGDSSYDTTHTHNGLSEFGEKVVKEMNRVGIMVDVSHITDSTFWDVYKITKAPVIASHSGCRFFTPGFERNAPDDIIKAIAETGGVIQINFGSYFLTEKYQNESKKYRDHIRAMLDEHDFKYGSKEANELIENYKKEHPIQFATVGDVANQIDHVVEIAGIDHVGIGSDFDGVGDSLPEGLKDVSGYPNLIYELLKRDYSEQDIKKIMGGNIMRIWQRVEEVANN